MKRKPKLSRWGVQCDDGEHTHSITILARKVTADTAKDFETVQADHVTVKLGMHIVGMSGPEKI